MKLRVYIETTIPSYLTGWPSEDPIRAAHQQVTKTWWANRGRFELFASELVLEECRKGDPEAASARLLAMEGIPLINRSQGIDELAMELVRFVPLPPKAATDALHIAMAAFHRMDGLLTWNCAHIANFAMWPKIREICRKAGLEPSALVTPLQLP